MTIAVEAARTRPDSVRAMARAVFKGEVVSDGPVPIGTALEAQGFTGEVGETAVVSRDDGAIEFFVGLGDKASLDAEVLRRAGASAAKEAKHLDALCIDTGSFVASGIDVVEAASALGEGAILATYRYAANRKKPDPSRIGRFVMVGEDVARLEAGAARAMARAGAVALARDLVNTPPGELTPTRFGELASALGAERGFSVDVFGPDALEEMGLGGLLGVARGSAEPPRLVRAEYVPQGGASSSVALVGKGITFDSGGLSLKSAVPMMTMKYDVAGAATVLAALGACRSLGVATRVVGYLPLTENMPGGRATKPGDVLHTRNGKTIEVLNTDAEGRLVLADALALAAEEGPDAIVDVATLTGAIVVALGKKLAGLMANDDRLAAEVERAAARAGEGVWRLPLPSSYRSLVDSEVADMKNVGPPRVASALVAGLILEEFVGTVPWAHLDIAGAGWSDDNDGYVKKGGTGFGVRTLLELLGHYEALGGRAETEPSGRKVVP